MNGLRILVAIKQVTQADFADFDASGRMLRPPEDQGLNPFCRRAIATGVTLANQHGGTCSVVSMGPPSATQILREALAVGAHHAYLLSDPRFAGSDALATAEVLARFIQTRSHPWDLILTGRFAIDANTGLVGVQLAEFLGLPYAGAAKQLDLDDNSLLLNTELDDGVRSIRVALPAVVAVAERICAPAKASPDAIEAVAVTTIQRLDADDLGFTHGSPSSRTRVNRIRHASLQRLNIVIDGATELDKALALLSDRLLATDQAPTSQPVTTFSLARVAYLCDPDQPALNEQLVTYLLNGCASNDAQLTVLAFPTTAQTTPRAFLGAHHLVCLNGSRLEDDLAPVIAEWLQNHPQQLVVAPATSYGRELGGRLGVTLDAGVLTDLDRLTITEPPTITGWKSVGSVASVAEVSTTTAIGIALLRPRGAPPIDGLFPTEPTRSVLTVPERGRVSLAGTPETQDVAQFANAPLVLAVGAGVTSDALTDIYQLAATIDAEVGCTRKIADLGLLPRSRQIGITGRSISPRLYIGVGTRGSHNHLSGVSGAGTTVNLTQSPPLGDPEVDLTIVGDWHQTLPPIIAQLRFLLER
ncbi:MAG: FAD-binding protein [Ferrimicrobium sp.]